MTHFADRLAEAVKIKGNPVMVGLDPRLEQLPGGLRPVEARPSWQEQAEAYRTFCRGVIDVVAPLVPVVKPQAAFFEQLGPAGMVALADVIAYARQQGLLVVFDGKRNDIGSTAAAYAAGILGPPEVSAWGADALTVSPYLGDDSLMPFVEVAESRGAGVFVLVKTSNPGGAIYQDLLCSDRALYQHIAGHVEDMARHTCGSCGYGAVGAVVGATYPEQLFELRSMMPSTWFLVPGYGTQGGKAEDVVAALDEQGLGAVINNSRGIIFAHALPEYDKFGEARWQEAVEMATCKMIEELRGAQQ